MTPQLDCFLMFCAIFLGLDFTTTDFTATKMEVFMVYGLALEIPHLKKFSFPSYSLKCSEPVRLRESLIIDIAKTSGCVSMIVLYVDTHPRKEEV